MKTNTREKQESNAQAMPSMANNGCLASGSRIFTENELKAVEDLQPGDQILSYDSEQCEMTYSTVLAVKDSGMQKVHAVSIGDNTLYATSNHPFYSYCEASESCEFIRADKLTSAIYPIELPNFGLTAISIMNADSDSRTPPFLQSSPVDVGALSEEEVSTWDLEVEGTNNFVAEGFLVHNSTLTTKFPTR